MFNFFNMMDSYEDRKVDRYEMGDLIISTARATDSDAPYETAVSHPSYNKGEFVIVENYWNAEDAQKGHDKWVDIMNNPVLPKTLTDVSLSGVSQLLDMFGDDWHDFDNEDW